MAAGPASTEATLPAPPPDPAQLPTVDIGGHDRITPARPGALDVLQRLGHYVLLHELGRGGMGVVYAAYDEKLDRKVAIKVLRADGDAARRRLVREAQGLARLSHPNVVQIYEIGDLASQAFLAMEFIDGITLRSWRAERPRTRAEILASLIAAGRGLAAAHAVGLVHRDFKPDNVMIHRDGRVLVTDFGLVRRDGAAETPATPAPAGELRADLTQFGTIVGTPGYMPPEQFAGRTTDARSDQFSFCVSLWEMLLGQRPFVGASALEIEEAVLRGAVSQPPRSDVPTWLREHILRGFACEPSERWRTMDELLAALARDPTPRRRAIVAGGVATAVALSVGGWTAMANARERDARLAECERSGREIEADWNEATAAAIEQAFLATGRPQAASIWAHARQWMDDHARAWTALRTRTCTEARVDATRDEASFVSIADCLDERRAGFAGVLDVWAERDHSKLLLAASAAAALPPISLCADEAHLARLARPPTSLRPQIKGVQLQVERIKSMRQAGAYEAALASSQALLPEAEALGWAPLLALVRLEIGFDQAELGQYTDSRASVEQSFLDAASGGDELGMLNAATKLSHTVGNLLGQFEQGHYWGRVALAVLTHLGMEGTTAEASLHNSVGSIHFKQGAQAPALELYRRALAIYESALGPRAPAVATSLNNIASALRSAGEYGESLDPYTRALELREAVYGPDHPSVAYPLHGLGQSYKALGEYARARALLERAVSLREHGVEPAKLAGSRFGLAEVLWATDERPRARALAEAARDGFREAGAGSEKDLARVETWLREHPP